ncbi:MAG TPA: ATP-binding cassette domain-containing protein [Actinomycetota bacterium]|nr:ATP-binding cassette domain-containing protein [Actinomycetota bacterium]
MPGSSTRSGQRAGARRPPVSLRSDLPGRLRLDVGPMVANRALAGAVEELVRPLPAVTTAKANPASGSLLITYDRRRAPAGLPALVLAEVDAWLGDIRAAGASLPKAPPRALSRILKVARRRPGEGLGPVLLSAGGYALSTLQGMTVSAIANTARRDGVVSGLSAIGLKTTKSQLAALGAAAVVLTSAELWTTYWREVAWQRFARQAEDRLRTEVLTQILHQDMAFFDEHGTGQLIAHLTGDVATVTAMVEQADPLITAALNVVSGSILLTRATPRLAALAGASGLLMLVPVRLLRRKSWDAFMRRGELSGALSQQLESVLSGIVEVKSFTAEGVEARRFREASHQVASASTGATSLAQLQSALAGHFFFGGYALALTHGARRLLSGKLTEEQFNRVTFWYPRLASGLGRIQGSRDAYLGARAAAERLAGVLAYEPTIRDGASSLVPGAVRGDIAVEHLTFGYHPGVPVLRDVSFQVRAGHSLGIVGLSGSGKTTLLRLLMRFYDPDAGRILLDGQDIRELRVDDIREAIALVSQDVYLFDGTLAHNVRYGRPPATDEEVAGALQAAGAGDLLEALPGGIDAEVGERGHRLSGGQRQRLAIARALLKNARVLTLDEATSSLDAIAESAVTSSIRALGRTVIASTHRLAGVREADTIIVLDGGTVAEQGRHDELLDRRGLYYDLWEMQRRAG